MNIYIRIRNWFANLRGCREPNVSKHRITYHFILLPADYHKFVEQGIAKINERKRAGLACDRFVISRGIYNDLKSFVSRNPDICPCKVEPFEGKKSKWNNYFLGLPLIVDKSLPGYEWRVEAIEEDKTMADEKKQDYSFMIMAVKEVVPDKEWHLTTEPPCFLIVKKNPDTGYDIYQAWQSAKGIEHTPYPIEMVTIFPYEGKTLRIRVSVAGAGWVPLPDYGEPWEFDSDKALAIKDRDGEAIYQYYEDCIIWDDEKMDRAVACVSACAGVPTDKLKDAVMKCSICGSPNVVYGHIEDGRTQDEPHEGHVQKWFCRKCMPPLGNQLPVTDVSAPTTETHAEGLGWSPIKLSSASGVVHATTEGKVKAGQAVETGETEARRKFVKIIKPVQPPLDIHHSTPDEGCGPFQRLMRWAGALGTVHPIDKRNAITPDGDGKPLKHPPKIVDFEENDISKTIRDFCEKMATERFKTRVAMLERLLLATISGEKLVLRETRKSHCATDEEIVYEYRFEPAPDDIRKAQEDEHD